MGLRSLFYTLARLMGDISAIQSPGKAANRIKNKGIGRVVGKRLYGRRRK